MYEFLNVFFFVFHVALILFNVFGWMSRRLRKANLITLLLTLFSWVVLGIFYGFGYCFLTDWHWDVRERLALPTESNSYIHFLVTSIPGVNIAEGAVDVVTVCVFFGALLFSILVNYRDWRKSS